MGLDRVKLFLSYYDLAVHVQNDASSLKALKTRKLIAKRRLDVGTQKEAAALTAYQLVKQQQQNQAALVLKCLYSEWKQFRLHAYETHVHTCVRLCLLPGTSP